jgi:hypothetical protein
MGTNRSNDEIRNVSMVYINQLVMPHRTLEPGRLPSANIPCQRASYHANEAAAFLEAALPIDERLLAILLRKKFRTLLK